MNLEKDRMEAILCALDEGGYLFPGFELVKHNNQLCLLGKGGFSTVYEMQSLKRRESQYVLKVIGFERQVMTSENFKDTVCLQHYLCEQTQYISRIISAKEIRIVLDDEGRLQEAIGATGERWNENGLHIQFILMEKLEDIIAKNRFGKISLIKTNLNEEDEVINFAFQVGQALHCAHLNSVLHRDVKLENIFWDKSSQCYKLGDFGMAKFVTDGTADTVVYTDGYGAPEIERRLFDHYDATADIYSFGITLYLLLNDFRFPGSDGYYVNMVQYNPEFVFPAPVHASEGMTRIIRKMCQFYQEDRYQSISEMLMDLSVLKRDAVGQGDNADLPDLETETYREDRHALSADENVRKNEITGRAKRKEEEKITNQIYTETSVLHFVGFTLLFTLLLRSMQVDSSIVYDWHFWIFPIMVLVEAVLMEIKEFHILFGGITLAVGVYSCVSFGVAVQYILLMFGMLANIPIITGACATSTVLWTVLIISEKMQWLDFLGKYDLSWVLLLIVFFMINRYVMLRIDLNKVTHIRAKIDAWVLDKIYLFMAAVGLIMFLLENIGVMQIPDVIQKFHLVRTGLISFGVYVLYMYLCGYIDDEFETEEERMYEDEMVERGDRERSDTIE